MDRQQTNISKPHSSSLSGQNLPGSPSTISGSNRGHGSFLPNISSPIIPISGSHEFTYATSDASQTKEIVQKQAVHRLNASGSVQALVVDDTVLFAGLQGGDIVVWSLETYERIGRIHAHFESVLGLSLSEDKSLLFSCGVDSIVNVWSTRTLELQCSLSTHYEVGDIFCVAYSSSTRTMFCGAQNSSIQWQEIFEVDSSPDHPELASSAQKHKFFDSNGPGADPSTLSQTNGDTLNVNDSARRSIMISKTNYLPFAHKSYIYSMVLTKGLLEQDPNQEVLITAGGGGTIKLWSTERTKQGSIPLLYKFKNKGSAVLSLAYKAPFLYAGLSNGAAHVYNLSSLQLVQKLQLGCGDVTQIQILNGTALCSTSQGWIKKVSNRFTEIERWTATEGKILATAVLSTKDRDFVITGGNDKTLAFWDVSEKRTSPAVAARSNDELLDSLRRFVSYRTVASKPRCVSDCHEAAAFLRKLFNAFGATTTLISPQEGVNPLLLAKFGASWEAQSKKTVLFYGHYDVVDAEMQGPDGQTKWLADPFNLHPSNGFLYGRGVTDNKGPILAALYAVADLVQQQSLYCNVVFLLEGDEEAGSRGFRTAVQEHKAEIGSVDYILLSNSYWLDDHIPCLTFGMRGVVHANITVTSNKPDLHSGMDGKSMQHEPLKDLTVLLASLIGPDGTDITIPGFHDTIDPLQPTELRAYKSIATSLIAGHPELTNEDAFAQSLMQRWRDPNLTVHQIIVPEAQTTVTISRSATATLSIRIVPSQTSDSVAVGLERYLKAQFDRLQSNNTVKVTITSKADPWLGRIHSDLYEELREAIVESWATENIADRDFTQQDPRSPVVLPVGRPPNRRASTLASNGTFTPLNTPHEPLFIREGGSIPAISFLEKEFDAPAAMFPMGQASDNAHLDNERMRLENLYKGRDVLRLVFARLGATPNRALRSSSSSATI